MEDKQNVKIAKLSVQLEGITKSIDDDIKPTLKNLLDEIRSISKKTTIMENKTYNLEGEIAVLKSEFRDVKQDIKLNTNHREYAQFVFKILLYFASPSVIIAIVYLLLDTLFTRGII